jgi:tricorn protease-like protein
VENKGVEKLFSLKSLVFRTDVLSSQHRVSEEIETERIRLFGKHALIKAQTKDYVRDSQIRLIITPIAEQLLAKQGKEDIEKKLKSILTTLRRLHSQQPTYAAGNVLNLLIHLGSDLHRYDFSHLIICQAYLRGIALPEISFAYSTFEKTAFTETFDGILSVVFSPNGELVAAGTANGEIRLWQVTSGTPILTCKEPTDWVYSVAFSPDGKILASGSDDYNIQLWDAESGQLFYKLQGHLSRVTSVAFSPDGSMLASGSQDQSAWLWEVSTGQPLKRLEGHTGWIWSVAFSPDGKILASGSDDQSIRLWNTSTGQILETLQGHASPVRSVAFRSDGKTLAIGSNDGTIQLWDVSTGQFLRTLRSDRPYEGMNIAHVIGLTETQKASLRVLGAIEDE